MAIIGRTVVTSDQAPLPLGACSLGMTVTAGKMLYIAGQVGVDVSGSLVGQGDAAAQTRQALENIGYVLTSTGGDFGNVVEFTTYVVGRESLPGYLQGRS